MSFSLERTGKESRACESVPTCRLGTVRSTPSADFCNLLVGTTAVWVRCNSYCNNLGASGRIGRSPSYRGPTDILDCRLSDASAFANTLRENTRLQTFRAIGGVTTAMLSMPQQLPRTRASSKCSFGINTAVMTIGRFSALRSRRTARSRPSHYVACCITRTLAEPGLFSLRMPCISTPALQDVKLIGGCDYRTWWGRIAPRSRDEPESVSSTTQGSAQD
jgi:hypothetical protein